MVLVNGLNGGMFRLDCSVSLETKEEPVVARFFPFFKSGSFGEPIERRHFLPFPYIGTLGPLCFVSGMAVLMEQRRQDQTNKQLVGIVCFQPFESSESTAAL
ncbi:hypothetical protein DL93DRAFT_407226 [Clavulina sp. PMI_390]|nr:hypothetical protein DL93DRAFT_407226 [Clavulina sp. PMI_390]